MIPDGHGSGTERPAALRVAVVEDDPVIGALLAQAVRASGMQAALFGSAPDALRALGATPFDIVLMDINLPGMSGLEATAIIKERHPQVEVIVQTVMEDTDTILQAIKCGATGYILKGVPEAELIESITVVSRGGSFLTGRVARKMLQEFKERPAAVSGERFGLTPREEEILRELVNGLAYKEIAAKLAISFFTVNNHTRHIYEKMQVSSRAEAVARALSRQ